MNKEFVIYPSKKWHNEILQLPVANDETQKRVVDLLRERKMHITGGLYLDQAKIGFKYRDNDEVREIIKLERVSKGIVLITHKKSE